MKNSIEDFLDYLIENIDDLKFFENNPSVDKSTIVTFLKSLKKTKKDELFKIFTDGASRGNPGEAGAGFAVLDENDNIVLTDKRYLGIKTNNEAEYNALIFALEKICEIGVNNIIIHSDSELLVRQLNGVYKVKNPRIKELYDKVQDLIKNFNYKIIHIPREKNKLADKLANEAIDEKD